MVIEQKKVVISHKKAALSQKEVATSQKKRGNSLQNQREKHFSLHLTRDKKHGFSRCQPNREQRV